MENNNKDNSLWSLDKVPAPYWIAIVILLFLPSFCSDFVLVQIFGWTFCLGMIASSLMFLAGYGGMVSLVQMTIAGVAAYMIAIFGYSSIDTISLGWPWWIVIPIAIIIAAIFGTLSGALAVRTQGIYTIMITLAIAAAFFYFVTQNYTMFNGFTGFREIKPPNVFNISWRNPIPFYYLCLFFAALSYFAILYVSGSTFGLSLQGIKDNPRRMSSIGFNVTSHRIAAYTFASVIASFGGILLVWLNGQISPGTVGVGPSIDILVIAVIGGIGHPIGSFIGAFIYVIFKNFSMDILVALGLPGERFKLLIGLVFLVIVFWSPDGLLGLWKKWIERIKKHDPLKVDKKEGI